MSPPPAFQEHVLNAPDVCNSCFRIVREPRDRLTPIRYVNRARVGDLPIGETGNNQTVVEESYYGRTQHGTVVDYPPTETPTDARRVFCRCGASSAFAREWDEADVDRERFKTLLKRLARTLDRKGVTVDRKAMFTQALSWFDSRPGPAYLRRFASCREEWTVNHCLGAGMDAGIARAMTRSGPPPGTPAD